MNGLLEKLERLTLMPRWQVVTALSAGGYSVIAFVADISDAYASKDYWFLISTGLFLAFLAAVVVRENLMAHRPSAPLKKGEFHGPGLPKRPDLLKRPVEAKSLADRIEVASIKPLVVAGVSGVGKSALLKTEVEDLLKNKGWHVSHIDSYTDLRSRFKEIFRPTIDPESATEFDKTGHLPDGFTAVRKSVLIFDQFETYFTQGTVIDPHFGPLAEWFEPLVAALMAEPEFRTVFVVRKEWYYDFTLFFRKLDADAAKDLGTIYFAGIAQDTAKEAWEGLKEKFFKVTRSRVTPDLIQADMAENGQIRPIEAQIVGLVIQNLRKPKEFFTPTKYRKLGLPGLIDHYLSSEIMAYTEPKKLSKVLFALSVQLTQQGRPSTASELAVITHLKEKDIEDCIEFLEKRELVLARVEESTHQMLYQLAHDYIADKIESSGSIQIHPVDRDNIALFSNHLVKGRSLNEFCRPRFLDRLGWSDWLLIFACVVILFRLISPNFGLRWDWIDPNQQYNTYKTLIDFYYVPIAVTHLTWLIYINLAYRRFLACLRKETFSGRLLSTSLVPLGVLLALLTTVISPFWLSLLCVVGFFFGAKMFLISRRQLSTAAKEAFSRFGILTMSNMVIVFALGLAYAYFAYFIVNSQDLFEYAQVILYVLAALMVYYMFHVRGTHVSVEATARFLGLYDRNWPEVSTDLRPGEGHGYGGARHQGSDMSPG